MDLNQSSGRARGRFRITAAVVLTTLGIQGQSFLETRNFRVGEPYEPPHESQIKSLFEGGKARSIASGQWLVTEAKVTAFRVTGELDLTVKAPECVFNQSTKAANSAGPMHAEMADGSFSIEGVGFSWQQTNANLVISNQVHTVVRPKALAVEPGKPGAGVGEPKIEAIDIFSHSFDYTNNSGLAVYRGDVRVLGTNLSMTSRELTVDLPMPERQIRQITADSNVVIDYTNTAHLHATGEHAVYAANSGLIHLNGKPTWQVDDRQGRGDELVIDRSNRVFNATGNAWLKLPTQGTGNFSLLSSTNRLASGQKGSTNQALEVWSHEYEFHTNWAVFRDKVRLNELAGNAVRGKMSCGWMKAFFTGSNELQSLVAATNVVIEEEDKHMTGGLAVYTGTNGWLDLTEHASWKAGAREGHGGLVRVLTQSDEMQVQTNAFLRLPANELGSSEAFGPPSATKKNTTRSSAPQFAEIRCNQYRLRSDEAHFEGQVRAQHPQMNWVCDRLTVRALGQNGKVLFAEGGVTFDLTGEGGEKVHGKGDTVVYTNSVSGSLTNDIVYLRGNPAMLETTNVIVFNKLITLDRANNLMTAPGGNYKIKGTAKAIDTNTFRLPKGGVKK